MSSRLESKELLTSQQMEVVVNDSDIAMPLILGIGLALVALSVAVGTVARLLFGPIEPMNASALMVGLVSGLGGAIATVLFVVMITHFYLQLTGAEGHASVPSSR